MDPLTIGLIVLGLVFLQGIGLYFVLRRRESTPDTGGLTLLQNEIKNLERALDSRMAESSRAVHESMRAQSGEANRLIREITEELTSVKEIGRQQAKFSDQMQSLQDVLKNPKQRGVLGEYYLETVLKNVLPPGMYEMQYAFKNGEIVDAAVFMNKKVVPIDSKFSLENYNRFIAAPESEKPALEKLFVNDLKLRITETAKYIRPEEDTMDFAFMFIPSEGIYYDLLTNQIGAGQEENLLQQAQTKYKVIIVSPTSFLAYLQTVMQGLKALQIEQKAVEIQKRVGELVKHIDSSNTFYQKLGASLGTVVSHYNAGYKELGKIDKDVYRITGEKAGVETLTLEKPSTGDE